MSFRLAFPACLMLAAPVLAAPPAAVTIYTRDLAFVRETRTLDLRSARDTVRLSEVPDRIDVSSVRLTPAGKARVTAGIIGAAASAPPLRVASAACDSSDGTSNEGASAWRAAMALLRRRRRSAAT